MLNLEIQDIMRAATSLAVFKRGNDYYKNNKVVRCQYDAELERLYAKVDGSESYHIDIRLDEGFVDDAYCDCRAYHEYPGFCKHIIATLLYAKFNINIEPETVGLEDVIDYYMDQDFEDISGYQPLEVEYILTIHHNLEASLTIKIGLENMYVLKEPKHFLDHIHKSYAFGKKFTYEPYLHSFVSEDIQIFEFLKGILESYKNFNERQNQYKNIDTKDIYLSDFHLIQLLQLIHKPLTLKLRDCTTEVSIFEEDILSDFVIEQKTDNFQLNLKGLKSFEPLTEDCRVLKRDEKLYIISEQQKKELYPLFQMLTHHYEGLSITKEEINGFMSYMYPVLERTSNIVVDEALEKKLVKYPCKSKLYLDQQHHVIYADLKYIYGDHTFDTFKDMENKDEDHIILRDLKQENKIMHIMESSAFKVSKDGYYMDNDEDIYNFLVERLPILRDSVEIFYSDAFNKLEVREKEQLSVHSTLEESGDFFSFKFSVEGIDPKEVEHLIDHIKMEKKFYRLSDGTYLTLDDPLFGDISYVLNDLDLTGHDFDNGEKRLPTYLAYYFNETLGQTAILDEKLKQIVEAPEQEHYDLPEGLNATLRPYQHAGFNWLKTLSKYGFGGILADDMGLGKTIQTLSYIQSEVNIGKAEKILIVAPTSLIYNWMNEINKFYPEMKALIVDGNKKQRTTKLEAIESYDLLITSYAMVRNDQVLYETLPLDICIIDEAQHIKNPMSKTAKAIKSLNIKRKFALTGTPIENRVLELWSIFDFIMPGYLGNMNKFRTKYEIPMKNNEPTSLSYMIQPFIMRRLKGDVLKELPAKIENKIIVDLNDDQKKVYMAYLERVKEELKESYKEEGYRKSQMKTLAALTRLRQICLDPGLFMDDYEGSSAKLDLLKELLEELIDGGHRVLIFSQFTSMLAKVKVLLEEEGLEYFYLDGRTKAIERGKKVDEFNEGKKPVFLISLKAGGTGLNLTGADTVIHCDPWWNPAVEDQATDRAHRIGQDKTVHVIKIVTKGTIEEKIYELQEKKKAMINQVIQPGETFITGLSEDEIRALFN